MSSSVDWNWKGKSIHRQSSPLCGGLQNKKGTQSFRLYSLSSFYDPKFSHRLLTPEMRTTFNCPLGPALGQNNRVWDSWCGKTADQSLPPDDRRACLALSLLSICNFLLWALTLPLQHTVIQAATRCTNLFHYINLIITLLR